MRSVQSSPTASIIIPCYNAELWIADCLDSATAQSYRPLEIIIIDDGSTDRSLQVIQRYAEQYPEIIRYETGPNRGGCAARNRGFALSHGDYVMFLDADDLINANTIEALVCSLWPHTHAIANCPVWKYVQHGNNWGRVAHEFSQASALNNNYIEVFLVSSSPPPCSLLWPRNLVNAVAGWDEELVAYQDVDFLFRALLVGRASFIQVSDGLSYYRASGIDSVSQNDSDEAIRSRLRVLEKVRFLLGEHGIFDSYRIPLAQAFYGHAVRYMLSNPKMGYEFLRRAYQIGGKDSVTGTAMHKFLTSVIGLRAKMWLSVKLAELRINPRIRLSNRSTFGNRRL